MDLYTIKAATSADGIKEYLSKIAMVWLPNEHRQFLSEPFSTNEIEQAIEARAGSKAPGLDGFSGASYKAYKRLLASYLLEVYAEALEKGILPPSFKEAVLILLPKPGKDPEKCAHIGRSLCSILSIKCKQKCCRLGCPYLWSKL